jgi:hypothetical protein
VKYKKLKRQVIVDHEEVALEEESNGFEDEQSCSRTEKIELTVDGSWSDIPLSIDLNAKLFIDYRKLSETAESLPQIPTQDVKCHNLPIARFLSAKSRPPVLVQSCIYRDS